MELSDYLRIVQRRGWLIILLAILTAGAAFGFSKMQDEVYRASVKLIVSPARTDFGQAQAAKTLLLRYVTWLDSSYRAGEVIDALDLDMEAGTLKGDVSFSADEARYVIQVDVKNTNPSVAQDIARVWAERLIQDTNENNATQRKEDRVNVELQDNPTVGLYRPNTKINTAAGLIFGALVGVLLIFALEWMESGTLRRAEDVERFIGVPVIGKIPS
jgi:capsular polysaccharide biosynthesis protein